VIVVDTSALLAVLNGEPERDRFLDILANDDRPMVSAVTLYETMLVVGARRGPDNLDDLEQMLTVAEAQIVPFHEDHARAAHSALYAFRQRYPSDCPLEPLRLRCLCPRKVLECAAPLQRPGFSGYRRDSRHLAESTTLA